MKGKRLAEEQRAIAESMRLSNVGGYIDHNGVQAKLDKISEDIRSRKPEPIRYSTGRMNVTVEDRIGGEASLKLQELQFRLPRA
jgi:hypothetical protein